MVNKFIWRLGPLPCTGGHKKVALAAFCRQCVVGPDGGRVTRSKWKPTLVMVNGQLLIMNECHWYIMIRNNYWNVMVYARPQVRALNRREKMGECWFGINIQYEYDFFYCYVELFYNCFRGILNTYIYNNWNFSCRSCPG